jgi:hypothetical protein
MFNLLYSYILLWMIQRVGRSRNDFDIEIFTHGDDILITDTTKRLGIFFECQACRFPFLE